MSSNSGKVSGNSAYVSDYDLTLVAGSSYNANPCTRVNEEYYNMKDYIMVAGGLGETNLAYPRYENVDSSSAFHSGKIVLMGLNGLELQSGAGGVNIETTGNINAMASGGIISFTSTGTFAVTSKQIELNPMNLLAITTPHVYVEAEDTILTGNVKIGGNVGIVGGLFVNGPLFCTQLSACETMSFTKEDSGTGAKINPKQTFKVSAAIPILTNILKSLGADPPSVWDLVCEVEGENPLKADILVEPHIHPVMMPSINPMDGTSEMFESAKVIDNKEPAEVADPNEIIKKQFEKIISDQVEVVKKWAIEQLGLPF